MTVETFRIIDPKKTAQAICRALRLDASRVKSVTMTLDHRGLSVQADILVDDEMVEGVAKTLSDT